MLRKDIDYLEPEERIDNRLNVLDAATQQNSCAILNLLKMAEQEKKIETIKAPTQEIITKKAETASNSSQPTAQSNTNQLTKHSVFTPKKEKIAENPAVSTLRFRHFYFHYL